LTITETPLNAFDGYDWFITKYLVTIPIPDKSLRTVAGIFESLTFITDMGIEYKNSVINDI